MKNVRRQWDTGQDMAELIDKAIKDEPAFLLTEGGIIKEGYHKELDELRKSSTPSYHLNFTTFKGL